VSQRLGLSGYFVVFAALWMVAMTWRIYPQFKDTLRIDGRLTVLSDYVEESCGQRIGPGAESCLEEARTTGRRLLAQEQGKSILLIVAPVLLYLVIYLPLRLIADRIGGRRRAAEEATP